MRKGAKTQFARNLRRGMTDPETHLWFRLRRRQLNGFRFRRRHPLDPYILDFACVESHLVVELDGSQHLGSSSDPIRDAWLRERGFHVLRLWNDDVLLRTDGVLSAILAALS